MNFDENLVKAEMVQMMKMVDNIFRYTDFDQDGKPDGISISVGEIVIRKSKENISYVCNSEEFLDFASLQIQTHCLSVWFSYRTFTDYQAYSYNPLNSVNKTGGICQKPIMDETIGQWRSKNLIYVSYVYFKERTPTPIILAKLVHEIGHCFGSPDDPRNHPICSPVDFFATFGNYIMHQTFVAGIYFNNHAFSLCSRRAIHSFIQRRGNCFKEGLGSVCGDGITEADEECDCGYKEICDFIDKCCVPTGSNDSDKECTFRKSLSMQCSPHEDECCNEDCRVIKLEERVTCFPENPCKYESICDGKSESCPAEKYKTDGSPCFGTFLTCYSGECYSNPCLDHNLIMCYCSSGSGEECHVCCFNGSSMCQSISKFGYFAPNGKLFLKIPETVCAEGKGECNSDGVCVIREIDENPEKSWFSFYWSYLVTLVVSLPACFLILLYVIQKWQTSTKLSAVTPQMLYSIPNTFSYRPSYLNVESNLDRQHSAVFDRNYK